MLALILAVTPPDGIVDEPPAPRWPGALAMMVGGSALMATTVIAATGFDCSLCTPKAATDALVNVSMLAAGSTWLALLGMGWLVWTQPKDEPAPRSPGVSAALSGVAQIAWGVLRLMIIDSFSPSRAENERSAGVLLGTGFLALTAGVAWAIWIGRR